MSLSSPYRMEVMEEGEASMEGERLRRGKGSIEEEKEGRSDREEWMVIEGREKDLHGWYNLLDEGMEIEWRMKRE